MPELIDDSVMFMSANLNRRRALISGLAAMASGFASAQPAPDYPLFSDLVGTPFDIDIDEGLRSALLAMKIFPAGKLADESRRFIAILSVDCIWCRYQFAQNLKFLHANSIHYALTFSEPKFAPLVNPRLLLSWETAKVFRSEHSDNALKIFMGINTLESVRRTPEQLEAIRQQAAATAKVMSLIGERFEPRGRRKIGFPLNFMVNASLTQLVLVAPGFSPTSYLPFIPVDRTPALYDKGMRVLRSYTGSPSSEVTEIIGKVLPETAWTKAGAVFFVPSGGRPFYSNSARTKKVLYVLVDPAHLRSRLMWEHLSVIEFYIEIRWVVVPDLTDDQSIASWLYLYRTIAAKGLLDVTAVEQALTSVMLGYEPMSNAVDPTPEEAAHMLESRLFADRLLGADQAIPIFIWKDTDKIVRYFSGFLSHACFTSLIDYSATG